MTLHSLVINFLQEQGFRCVDRQRWFAIGFNVQGKIETKMPWVKTWGYVENGRTLILVPGVKPPPGSIRLNSEDPDFLEKILNWTKDVECELEKLGEI